MGDEPAYPHNIFAEVVIENGIPGILVLIGLLGLAVARGIAGRTDPRTLFALLAFLFALWNAQLSGDLSGNEWIWLFAGILAGRQR
jgi:O-antigen ligase